MTAVRGCFYGDSEISNIPKWTTRFRHGYQTDPSDHMKLRNKQSRPACLPACLPAYGWRNSFLFCSFCCCCCPCMSAFTSFCHIHSWVSWMLLPEFNFFSSRFLDWPVPVSLLFRFPSSSSSSSSSLLYNPFTENRDIQGTRRTNERQWKFEEFKPLFSFARLLTVLLCGQSQQQQQQQNSSSSNVVVVVVASRSLQELEIDGLGEKPNILCESKSAEKRQKMTEWAISFIPPPHFQRSKKQIRLFGGISLNLPSAI